jgi:hypothetical protein
MDLLCRPEEVAARQADGEEGNCGRRGCFGVSGG